MKTYSFQAMGSRILLAMDTESEDFVDLCSQAVGWFAGWEQIFSRFRLTSELSELNSHTGQWIRVSDPFWQVFNLSLQIKEKTHGLVRPDTLNALENAGYRVSFEEMAEHIDDLLRQPILSMDETGEIEVDESKQALYLPRGTRIDLGGVVKGWAAQQTMTRLREISPVLVDAGGDIAVSGPMHDNEAWPVGVTNPFDAVQNLKLVMVNSGGLATSGCDYRRWLKDGHWLHHIIDPRIDRPAETDVMSATLFASDLVTAEAYAKMGLILGSREAEKTFSQNSELGYFLVLEDGTQLSNSLFNGMIWNEQWINQRNPISA